MYLAMSVALERRPPLGRSGTTNSSYAKGITRTSPSAPSPCVAAARRLPSRSDSVDSLMPSGPSTFSRIARS